MYSYAWFISFAAAFLVYVVLTVIAPPQRAGEEAAMR